METVENLKNLGMLSGPYGTMNVFFSGYRYYVPTGRRNLMRRTYNAIKVPQWYSVQEGDATMLRNEI